VEYVSSLRDPRNLATLALYGALLALAAAAAPWRAAAEALGLREAAVGGAGERAARWRAAVAAGLLVGPFFPASNVLFYVGTFIGERLLYFPSVGYCLLLAEPLAAALRPLSGGGGGGGGGGDGAPTRARRRAAAAAAAAALALLLGGFAAKTVLRNLDWRDEERLFIAAQKVSESLHLGIGTLPALSYNGPLQTACPLCLRLTHGAHQAGAAERAGARRCRLSSRPLQPQCTLHVYFDGVVPAPASVFPAPPRSAGAAARCS
jgi:hypothetical protein